MAFWLVVRLRSLLVMLLISFFLSFALEPSVNLLARWGWRRGLGTAAVFAAIVVAVVLFVGALGSLLVAQVGDLVDAIPGYVQQVTTFLNDRLGTSLSGTSWPTSSAATRASGTSSTGWPPGPSGCRPPWSAWSCRASPSGCSPSTWVADGPRLRRSVCSVL